MPRIHIIGCSGSGKSTLADAVHRRLGIPWLELDSLQHQPNWTALEPERFRNAVTAFMNEHQDWVIDGNYQGVSDLVQPRSTDLVWLDVSLTRVLWRLGKRSASRVFRRTELWNGNRESLRSHCSLDPGESVLLWAIKTHRGFPGRFEALTRDPALSHVRCRRIDGLNARNHWLNSL